MGALCGKGDPGKVLSQPGIQPSTPAACNEQNLSLIPGAFPMPEVFGFPHVHCPLRNSKRGRNDKNMKLNWIFAQHLSIQPYWCVRYVQTILIHDKEALADLWMLVVDIAYLQLVKSTHNSRRLRCSGHSPHLQGFVFPILRMHRH